MSEEKKDNGQIAQSVSGFSDKSDERRWKGVKSVCKTTAMKAARTRVLVSIRKSGYLFIYIKPH